LHRQPELQINTWVDDLAENNPNLEKIAAELNNRYEIYIHLRDGLERAKAILKMREQAATLAASLQRTIPSAVESSTPRRQGVNDNVRDILASLDPGTPKQHQAQIESLAKSCLATIDPGRAELLLTDLRVRVNRLNRATRDEQRCLAERRDKEAGEARDLIQRLGALGQAAEGALRDDLLKVSSGEAPFTEALRLAATSALAKAERNYAGFVLKDALEQLGYEVQDKFETLFAQDGSNFFQRPSWGDYHCRITVDADRERLNFDVVRYGAGETESLDRTLLDKEMEEKWCEEVPGLLCRLAENGVAVDLTRKLAPGSIALQVIDDERLKPKGREREKETLINYERSLQFNSNKGWLG